MTLEPDPLNTHVQSPQHTRNLALATVQALQMWSDERYRPFLGSTKPGELNAEWFHWFMGEWNVARTIKEGCQESVRLYLDREFRRAIRQGGRATAVDDAAQTGSPVTFIRTSSFAA